MLLNPSAPGCWRVLGLNRLVASQSPSSSGTSVNIDNEKERRLRLRTLAHTYDKPSPPLDAPRTTLKKSSFLSLPFEAHPKNGQHQVRPITTNTTKTMAAGDGKFTITLDNMNPCLKKMEYAVRGPLVIRATEIEKEIQKVS